MLSIQQTSLEQNNYILITLLLSITAVLMLVATANTIVQFIKY